MHLFGHNLDHDYYFELLREEERDTHSITQVSHGIALGGRLYQQRFRERAAWDNGTGWRVGLGAMLRKSILWRFACRDGVWVGSGGSEVMRPFRASLGGIEEESWAVCRAVLLRFRLGDADTLSLKMDMMGLLEVARY